MSDELDALLHELDRKARYHHRMALFWSVVAMLCCATASALAILILLEVLN